MKKDGLSLPPSRKKNEKDTPPAGTLVATDTASDAPMVEGEPPKRRLAKSFVRITPSRRPKAKPVAAGGSTPASNARTRKAETIVEGEVIEGDEDDEDRDDALGAGEDNDREDDDAFHRVVEGEVEFDSNLPAVSSPRREDDAPFADVEIDDGEPSDETEPEEKGLVVSSALQRYLAELRKYPLMTIEEERETARRAYEQNDMQARNRLVTANLRLVVKIAMEYRRAYSQILDLIQEGNAGLVQAVNRFNPYLNVKLSTYSAWWIRAYILKFLMDNKSLVRMGTTDAQRKLFFRLRGEAEKMYALTQRFDAHLLAENIGVKESDVIEMQQRLTKNDVSLDAPVRDDGDLRQVDTLQSTTAEPDAVYERKQLLALLREKVGEIEKELGERDAYIFRSRILAEEPVTLQDVGDKFGITRERARQLEARVLKRIKEALLEAGLGP
jgi:RNA polymerase sigma-32 factor